MNSIHARLLPVLLILCSLAGGSGLAFAGDDAGDYVLVPDTKGAAAQMDTYLQGRGIKHEVRIKPGSGDDKAQAPEAVTVCIYGVISTPEQDALCASLAAPARKVVAHRVSVEFYKRVTEAAAAANVAFQPSQLPSGNGDVSFAQNSDVSFYRLLRTVKL